MLSERFLTTTVNAIAKQQLVLEPTEETHFPPAEEGRRYMLYMHVPFCERLCPFCSFNRYPFREDIAKPYFANMRKEMLMLKDLGYDFESIYFGGGTPTIMVDELCETIDVAKDAWNIEEIGCETNPNHLNIPYLEKMKGRIQRMSVGVQSFNNDLLKTMDRYEKYGSGEQIYETIQQAIPYFDSLNVDMIFNFPTQEEDVLISDLEKIATCGARQTTFSPLYVSNGTFKKMAAVLGPINWKREYRYYQLIDGILAGGKNPLFRRSTLWTFTRNGVEGDHEQIDEYQTNYVDYPAIGSGSITHLKNFCYVNHFSIKDYNEAIESGKMAIMGKATMTKRSLMRYHFLLNLYKLRLDKHAFKEEFGVSVEAGLPVEMTFMRTQGAFEIDDDNQLTLTPVGRYLTVVMYRQFLAGMNNLREQAREQLTGYEHDLLFGDGQPA
ncbi:MAG: coproporphyrinogen III oxidase family protein [Coriobacteriia bacterium]|nr:coproporphyrinogen III oxidase family protein [Coriobacteriia bacterium]